jgi:C-terminal processing protease CtpA/Prc
MGHLHRRSGLLLLAALLLAAGPLGAAPPKAPKPPVPPEPPVPPAVEIEEDDEPGEGPAIVRVVTGSRAYLGVHLTDLSPELREHFGAPRDAGVMISSVEEGSPAAKAGLKVGDIVTKAGGRSIVRASDLSRAVHGSEEGKKLSLVLVRDRTQATLEVPISARKGPTREIRVGEWGPHAWNFRIPEFDQERFDAQMERLREKLAALEAKLKELEKRFSGK